MFKTKWNEVSCIVVVNMFIVFQIFSFNAAYWFTWPYQQLNQIREYLLTSFFPYTMYY